MAFLLELLFWLSAGSIGFAYAGYPILTYCLGALFRRQIKLGERHNRPAVSFVLVVHNAREQIVRRLQNLLESSANPEDEIIVVCDGCSDDTVALAKSLHSPLVRVEQVPRGGKASGLNHGVSLASREIVIFCDARQSFEPGAADQLLRYFADSRTGAVSGNLSIAPSQSGAGRGVDVYWRLEKFIRRWESAFDSAIGCTGAFYAIRRSLYEPLPADTLLDDVVTPMRIAERGYRVLFAPEAIAWEPQRLDPANERRRKPRTLAGNYQMLFRYPHWSLPWRFRLWWQLWSHRYLRLLGVPLLATMFLSSSGLALHQPFYRFLFAGECGLLALALCGLAFPRISLRLVTIPSAFLLLQWTSVHGLFFYLRMLQQKNRPPGVTW